MCRISMNGALALVVMWVAVGLARGKVEMQHLNDKNFTIHCDSRYYREPSCKDSSSGYQCLCGDGFEYNKEGMCIAVSTNSRLEFTGTNKPQYAILLGKPFRALDAFTVTFWIKLKRRTSTGGYIVSYSVRDHPNIFYLSLKDGWLQIKMYNESMTDAAPIVRDDKEEYVWRHVAFSWDSKGGKWIIYVNGNQIRKGSHFGSGLLLPASGETVLGARSQHYAKERTLWGDGQSPTTTLQMDLSHFHIWFTVLISRDVRMIMKDCPLKYCGTAIRWTDFRDGTRGALKLRWPSGVYNRCFGEWMDDEVTCDRYCSVIKGARCREEMIENVRWPRTERSANVSVPCPGKSENDTKLAYRMCHISPPPANKGKWDPPKVDECLDNTTKSLLSRADFLSTNKQVAYDQVFPFLDSLVKATLPQGSYSPNDLAGFIKVAELILEFQEDRIRNRNWLVDRWQNDQSTKLYPNSSDVKLFMMQYMKVFDNLLPGEGNKHAWNLTKPFGQSLVHLLNIMVKFVDIHAGVLLRDVVVERSSPITANFSVVMEKLAINMEVYFSNHSTTLRFPKDEQSGLKFFHGYSETKAIIKQKVWGPESSLAKKRAFVVTTLFISNVREFLPNPYTEHKNPQEDNLNSALYLIRFFPEDPVPLKPRYIVTTFSYLSTKNISDSQCFRLQYEKIRKGFVWKFSKQDCVRVHHTISRAMCTCNDSGYFYGVTTDMYDPNWVEEKVVIYFMNWATYFGCAMSALCSLLGFCILVFLRTSSNTSALHKNTSLAVGFAQLSLMCGIDLHEFRIPCWVFTIATLYFILCLFCWMMNQAFHIYTVVTYSAHSNDEVENGSVVKFMIMGWVVPMIPVMVGAVSKGEKFLNKNACFVSWDWFIIVGGPGVGVIFVTLLMKGIALKEYLQSSYSLSEKGNKLVVNYMKAGRSQWGTILAMYCCLILALWLHSTVLKFLFAIFSILQGSSLLCFSVLMNDEVRSMWMNNYEGSKDKDAPDVLEEIHALQHQRAIQLSHQRSIDKGSHDRMSHDKEPSFRGASFDNSSLRRPSGQHRPPTPMASQPSSPEPSVRHRPGEGPGPISSFFAPVLELAHGVLPHFGERAGTPRDAVPENDHGVYDDTGMMDTAI